MKKISIFLIILVLATMQLSCRKEEIAETPTPIPPARSTATPTTTPALKDETQNKPVFADITDFESGNNAYEYGFANYNESKDSVYELTSNIQDIPDNSSKGLFMSGNNQSESLLMYLSKSIVALPDAQYTVKIDFDIATNLVNNVDDGNNNGQAMYVKAGVTTVPFSTIIDGKDFVRTNLDLGSLVNSGPDGRTLGTVEKVNSEDESYQYRHFTQSFRVTTKEDGLISILIAVESNISGVSSLYFDNIIIELAEE